MGKEKIVQECIRNPIGCLPLTRLVKGKKSILILTDDNTRFTPLRLILPPLLNELKNAGIKDKGIKILVASGTHRPMKPRELIDKFGSVIVRRYKIYNHRWIKKAMLTQIDAKIYGEKICVNKLAKESDFIIGIGSIVPHATTGFSGGGKIILPGICGQDTTEDMHWKALKFEMKDILGVYDNPMRRMVDSVAKKVGLRFIINVIMDNSNKIVDIVAGDPVMAHKKGVEISRKAFGLCIKGKADIVVADAQPMDIDLRQAIKAVCAADLVVKEGGVIVLVARCPEGVSPQFPEFKRYGFGNPSGLKKMVEEGRVKGRLMAYTLITIGRIMKYRAKVILVSRGISCKTAYRLGFLWASSVKEALKEARQLTRHNADIIFLKRACEQLPILN